MVMAAPGTPCSIKCRVVDVSVPYVVHLVAYMRDQHTQRVLMLACNLPIVQTLVTWCAHHRTSLLHAHPCSSYCTPPIAWWAWRATHWNRDLTTTISIGHSRHKPHHAHPPMNRSKKHILSILACTCARKHTCNLVARGHGRNEIDSVDEGLCKLHHFAMIRHRLHCNACNAKHTSKETP